jgi:hypothetical protein
MRKTIWFVPVFLLWAVASAFASDTVLTWPASGKDTMLRFTLGKLHQITSVSGQNDYLGEALAENQSTTAIPSASFYLYLLDKNGKRVGEGYLEVTNLAAGQRAKIPVTAHAMGSFVSMELQPQHLPSDEPMKIRMSISSVPAGASVKLDAQDSGVTPEMLRIAPGKHVLEFSKEGYVTASTPVEIAVNALPGSVELELNPLTLDTVVLSDETVLMGNLISVNGTGVNITVKGKPMNLARSRVARIVLGKRKASAGNRAATSGKSSSRSK